MGSRDAVLDHTETGWELHLVLSDDGLYIPALVSFPAGAGPFGTVISLHPGSGGEGLGYLVDEVRNRSSLFDRLLGAGLAVVVTEGRAENEHAYGSDGAGVLDHDDVVAVFRHVRELERVDPQRVGFFGVSHGGELQLKAAVEMGGGPAALVPTEPAVIELLGLRYPGPRTEAGLQYRRHVEDSEIDLERATERLSRVPDDLPIVVIGRDDDHLQGLFRKLAELLERLGKRVEWLSFDHPQHAYQHGPRRTDSGYALDPVTQATQDAVVAALTRHLG
jgi:dienelactone hydrolase